MAERGSVAMPSCRVPLIMRRPLGSPREMLRRETPVKITRKPQSREMVFTASDVLKPP
jgi:hypothetical protein